MKEGVTAFLCGSLFALGLGLSQMTNPGKILGFLNVMGNWDPTLLVVFIAASGVYFLGYRFLIGSSIKEPLESYLKPKEKIDKFIIIGAILFGLGWGLIGLCPGPALTNFITLKPPVLVFLIGMISGIYLVRIYG